MLLCSKSHRCSMGFKRGDFADHGNAEISWFGRNAQLILAACRRAYTENFHQFLQQIVAQHFQG